MFRCYSYTIIRERINLCLLKLRLLKQAIKLHRYVVMWLHILRCTWGLLPNSATYTHQQRPTTYTSSRITTHKCKLIGYFNNCNLIKHEQCALWWWCGSAETCRICFNVNFNVNFNIVFKTIPLCISWWINKTLTYIFKMTLFHWNTTIAHN